MGSEINQEIVNDTAKLIMHRLIARVSVHDPSLIQRAKVTHERISIRFSKQSFVREWDELLKLPPNQLVAKLKSRDSEMRRLRISSPLVLAEGIDFSDYGFRRRIYRAAKRLVQRRLDSNAASISAA